MVALVLGREGASRETQALLDENPANFNETSLDDRGHRGASTGRKQRGIIGSFHQAKASFEGGGKRKEANQYMTASREMCIARTLVM